ncbi:MULTISPECIES: hypothetical protein [Micromonospora]|uniref:LPXTG-motif cell wall anchor domain-containing protein n=1 Tax=Micromonospora yangpuensis TaxID=683228 RepID=A0A1C6UB73_9ACTN|nr:hypothetical protein [Micromonospora yangpuensis]GGL86852.1 hypothetical protein GCM10012279_00670 [Micromonospora yangpuensis]SCL51335.1 hypothetical protein GA0070617_1750 [Micromonospora yangpuensis]
MIRPPLSLRRPLALAAASLLGLTAFAVSSPASASAPSPTPSASASTEPAQPPAPVCVSAEDARYTHTFDGPKGEASITLVNGPLCAGQEQDVALVSYLAPSARFATPQYVFDKSVKKFTGAAEGELQQAKLDFKVEVPACFTQTDFVFGSEIIDPLDEKSARYGDRKIGSPSGIGSRSKGPQGWYNGGKDTCVAAPAVEATSDCDGKVTLTLVNRGNIKATFQVTGSGEYTEQVTVAAGERKSHELTAEQAKEIEVSAKGMETWKGGYEKPEDCKQPEVGVPDGTYTSTCDEMIFEIKNPENGITVNSTFTPSKGKAKTVAVEPGKTEKVTFPASKGFTVTVTGDLDSGGPLKWTEPKECKDKDDEGGSGGGDTEEEGLPVTGAAAGGIAAGAAALLALGAVLFVVARRRRVHFTA